MSAFIVTNACIHRCVAVLAREYENKDDLGAALLAMNVLAVGERYGATKATVDEQCDTYAAPYKFERGYPCLPVESVKALRCLRYQCSEGAVPEEPLYKRLDAAINDLQSEIVSSLPGYDKASWG